MLNINEIILFKPQSKIAYRQVLGGGIIEIGRDFPKIIITTKHGNTEISYINDNERDEALRELTEKIKTHQLTKTNKAQIDPSNIGFSINVADSSNINIINQSSNAVIDISQVNEAKNIIEQIRSELEQYKDIVQAEEIKDISEAIDDIERKIDKKESIPKLSFNSLLQAASNFSSIGSLVISLGQILGKIPH